MKIYSIINSCTQDYEKQIKNVMALGKACGAAAGDMMVIKVSGDIQHFDIEYVLEEAASICEDADMILLPGNDFGSRMAISLGQRLGGSGMAGALHIDAASETISRKVYAGNLVADYSLGAGPWCAAADWTMEDDSGEEPEIHEEIRLSSDSTDREFCRERKVEQPEKTDRGLADASFILACGQGLKKKENVLRAAEIAHAMGARVGASRPVVMNAWSGLDTLIGVSGAMVKPEVCITAAVSGAPAFFAGVEKSRTIIAINSDENAPIMKKSDLAVVGDASAVLEELLKIMER